MDKQLIINIDDALLEDAIKALEQWGIDIQTAVKIFITRLAKEQTLSFLLSGKSQPQISVSREGISNFQSKPYEPSVKGDMTKSRALSLFRSKGVLFNRNITFASKNRTANNYWANPKYIMLKDDWYLILNNWIKRELYLFCMPANTINESELTPRNNNLIDLQIMYNDKSFTDIRSGYSFAKYLIEQINY